MTQVSFIYLEGPFQRLHCTPLYYYTESIPTVCEVGTICISNRMVESVHKLGEGTFSEVFGCVSDTGTQLAVKVAEFLASYIPKVMM